MEDINYFQGACVSGFILFEQMLGCKQLWFDSRTGLLLLSPQLYWCTHRVTWPVKTPQGSEDPPPSLHSIRKKRKLGQRTDQLCGRWFDIVVWFVQASVSPFQHRIHIWLTHLWPAVSRTEERYLFYLQRSAFQFFGKKKDSCEENVILMWVLFFGWFGFVSQDKSETNI